MRRCPYAPAGVDDCSECQTNPYARTLHRGAPAPTAPPGTPLVPVDPYARFDALTALDQVRAAGVLDEAQIARLAPLVALLKSAEPLFGPDEEWAVA